MKNLKKLLPDLVAVVAFVVISVVYFLPAVGEGRILNQHDSVAGIGAGEEAARYHEATGERTRWTNSLFGGMPTYQIAPSYDSTDVFNRVVALYHLFLPDYVWYVFALLLGFYILLRAFDFRVWMAALGAVVWAFSSYFFIIIAAGHIWKVMTLAYIPPTIAGMVLCYRGRWLAGGAVTALFVAMQIKANHVQMSYYFLFCMFLMVLAFLVQAIREKQMSRFVKATGVLVLAGAVGICVNLSNLYHTYEYSKETMRGKSELVKADDGNQTGTGLDRAYITQWSYGIGETWSLLVPNVKGGASVPLAQSETAMKHADPQFMQLYTQIGQYWGEQPGTSGPVYAGALVCALFLLGALIVRGPLKWALLAATLLSFLFAWGKNLMPFTDFCIDYIPMYAKFRAVSSALVVAEFTVPLLALLGLKELCEADGFRKHGRQFFIAFGITGGVALLFAVWPGLFFGQYISSAELEAIQRGIDPSMQAPILSNLSEMREAMFTADAWRSLLFIAAGFAALLCYGMGKIRQPLLAGVLIVLCLCDMWGVNKRYLNDEMFVPAGNRTDTFAETETDKLILEDKALDYRVLNLAGNTFNENGTSYWHKSVGGYHAAKLRRYQELIDEHITPEIQALYGAIQQSGGDLSQVSDSVAPVINMLNTRWLIVPVQQGTFPLRNPHAYGNAWFVERVQYVESANEEIGALHQVNPRSVAVVDRRFKTALQDAATIQHPDSAASVVLKHYAPNALEYEVHSAKGGVVVFSEIWYPGWEATVDGKPASIGRADYVLRAMYVPAGKHTVTMTFDPKSIRVTEAVAWTAMILLLLGLVAAVLYPAVVSRNKLLKR